MRIGPFCCLTVCLLLGGCGSRGPATFPPEQVHIVAEGIQDNGDIGLAFTVDKPDGWACPGVNITRSDNGHIDVYFLRVKSNDLDSAKFAIPVKRRKDGPEVLEVRIPHDWNAQKEAEVWVDGIKSLGKWSQ